MRQWDTYIVIMEHFTDDALLQLARQHNNLDRMQAVMMANVMSARRPRRGRGITFASRDWHLSDDRLQLEPFSRNGTLKNSLGDATYDFHITTSRAATVILMMQSGRGRWASSDETGCEHMFPGFTQEIPMRAWDAMSGAYCFCATATIMSFSATSIQYNNDNAELRLPTN